MSKLFIYRLLPKLAMKDDFDYDRNIWAGARYGGLELESAARLTPLLTGFLATASKEITVIEAGPGVGGHTLRLARAGYEVHAVERSETAAEELERNCSQLNGEEGGVIVVNEELLGYIQSASIQGPLNFYAQGVFQFFTDTYRQGVLDELGRKQQAGDITAVSFKTIYDEFLGQSDRIQGAAVQDRLGARATAVDGSGTRLFIDPARLSSLRDELTNSRFSIEHVVRWCERDTPNGKEVLSLATPFDKPPQDYTVDWIGFILQRE